VTVSDRREFLDAFSSHPGEAGLFTDFDGTLAPIVTDPESAAPLPGLIEAMAHLATRLGVVAVVSGRPASFLARQFPVAARAAIGLYGLHGLEHWAGERAEPVEAARAYGAAVRQAVEAATRAAVADLVVEDKSYGLTLHWRKAADTKAAARAGHRLASKLACAYGLLERPGKASIELVPPTGIDKGSVVEALGASLKAVCFLGDDAGDLTAFSALDRLERAGARVFRIAVTSREAPEELLARADFVLAGPGEASGLLVELAESC
jgi:trehalose 6-phosphate phosphatase